MMMPQRLPGVHSFLRPARLRPVAYAMVLRLLLAFCCHRGKMTAAQAARLPRHDRRHKAAIGRFLGRKRWARGDWTRPLRAGLVARAGHQGGIFFLLLDQTLVSRQGDKTPNTFSSGNRTRRPRKGRRYSNRKTAPRRCHAFVFGLLLTPSGLRVPYRRSYYAQEYAAQKGKPFRTQAQLGALLVEAVARDLPAGSKVVVLGDTAFEAACVRQACGLRGYTWITPSNAERVRAGDKPRPKVRSILQELSAKDFHPIKVKPSSDPYASQRRWSAWRRGRNNQGRTYWVHKQRLAVHSVGVVSVFVSTTKRPKAGEPLHEPKILLSNDLRLTAREAVLRYTLRWQVELFFKELKGTLGLADYGFRDFERAERWADVAVATFLYLEWYRRKRLREQTDQPGRDRWGPRRAPGLAQAACQEAEDDGLRWRAQRLRTGAGRRRLEKLLRAACADEARRDGPAAERKRA